MPAGPVVAIVGDFNPTKVASTEHTTKDRDEHLRIRRKQAWRSPEEVQAVAERSKQVADDDFPDDIRWIRSYVLAEEDDSLGSICIYQATAPEAVRRHAHRVGMPADEIFDVAELVVIKPDPVEEASAS